MPDIDDIWDDDEDMAPFVVPREQAIKPPLTPADQAMIDDAWAKHAAASPKQRLAKIEEEKAELLAACRAVLVQVVQGPVFERDACITQVRNAYAAATLCAGIEIEPGVWSGCTAKRGDCPTCGK